MLVYRLSKRDYLSTAFSGEGARLAGARWNSRGLAMTYTSASISLAMLELLVQGLSPSQLQMYVGLSAVVPDDSLEIATLPPDWRNYPHPASTKRYGDEWLKSQCSLVLRVPSAILPLEFNYLLNPNHPRFTELQLQKPFELSYDERILKMLEKLSDHH